jgi:hypothetical protein
MPPKPISLDSIQHPVLVANGDTDVMVPSINSVELAHKLPHSELSIFPDAGHGAIFQYHSAFLDQTCDFCRTKVGAALSVPRQTGTDYGLPRGDTIRATFALGKAGICEFGCIRETPTTR